LLSKKLFPVLLTFLLGTNLWALQIDPEMLHFQSLPDEALKGVFSITNDQPVTVNLTLTLSDWKYDAQGQIIPISMVGYPHSLKSWLTADLAPITLAPGQHFNLPVQIKVPESVYGSHSTGIIIQGAKTQWLLVVHSVLGSIEKIGLEQFQYHVRAGSIHLSFKLKNEGEVLSAVSGYVAVIAESGLVLGKVKLEPQSFFAGESRVMVTDLPLDLSLPAGQNYFRFMFQSESDPETPLLKVEKPLLRDGEKENKPTQILLEKPQAQKPAATLKWSLQKITVQANSRRSLTGFLKVANQEDLAITTGGLITIFNAKGRQVFNGKIPAKTILAGYSDLITTKWNVGQDLKPGNYTAKIKLLYQNAQLAGETQFVVP
jgi:hypothetical protein